jgi:hypothetical protein
MNIVTPTDAQFQAESNASGISWSAVIGGAFVSGSFALIFILLGLGLGLSLISPWTGEGVSATAIGIAAVIWLIATHAIASGLGGYLSGRLRTKWSNFHDDEVYFRDTAHGFLVWALSVIITVVILGMAVSSIVSSGARMAGTAAELGTIAATSGVGDTDSGAGPAGYLADMMFRTDQTADAVPEGARLELARILAEALRRGTLPEADRTYMARVISRQTGLSQAEAERRVDAVYAEAQNIAADAESTARDVADDARKATRTASLWIFVALLAGAFCASYAATIGGRQRDSLTDKVVNTGVHRS